MPHLLYIHGFLSSPQSYKAQALEHWLKARYPEIVYHCPLLTPYPDECAQALEQIIQPLIQRQQTVYLMGSSMGGFWASYFAERYDLPAVLINPAVDALALIPAYVGQTLHNYHTHHHYYLTPEHIQALASYDVLSIQRHRNYCLLVQKGDETLDYRSACAKYAGCEQVVESGGDHSFQEFGRFHQPSIDFFKRFCRDRMNDAIQ